MSYCQIYFQQDPISLKLLLQQILFLDIGYNIKNLVRIYCLILLIKSDDHNGPTEYVLVDP